MSIVHPPQDPSSILPEIESAWSTFLDHSEPFVVESEPLLELKTVAAELRILPVLLDIGLDQGDGIELDEVSLDKLLEGIERECDAEETPQNCDINPYRALDD